MRLSGFILLLFFVFSCESDKRPQKPDDLISQEEMVNLLLDIQILNSAKSVNKKLLENQGLNPEAYIFKKHNIDSLRFAQSNAYYAYDAEKYEDILDKVQDRLDSLENHYNEVYQQEEIENKRKRDSLNDLKTKMRDSLDRTNNIPLNPEGKKTSRPKTSP